MGDAQWKHVASPIASAVFHQLCESVCPRAWWFSSQQGRFLTLKKKKPLKMRKHQLCSSSSDPSCAFPAQCRPWVEIASGSPISERDIKGASKEEAFASFPDSVCCAERTYTRLRTPINSFFANTLFVSLTFPHALYFHFNVFVYV